MCFGGFEESGWVISRENKRIVLRVASKLALLQSPKQHRVLLSFSSFFFFFFKLGFVCLPLVWI